MTRYTDELEPLISRAQELRRQIALRIAEEAGCQVGAEPTEEQFADADEAISSWGEEIEAELDLRAFRELTPLQELLADHYEVCERIFDIRDRRLS